MNTKKLIAMLLILISTSHFSSSALDQELSKQIKLLAASISTIVTGFFATKEGETSLGKELSKVATIVGVCALYDIYRGRSLVGLVKDTILIALAYKLLNNEPVDGMIERWAKRKTLLKSVALEDEKKTYQLPRAARLLIAYKLLQEVGLLKPS